MKFSPKQNPVKKSILFWTLWSIGTQKSPSVSKMLTNSAITIWRIIPFFWRNDEKHWLIKNQSFFCTSGDLCDESCHTRILLDEGGIERNVTEEKDQVVEPPNGSKAKNTIRTRRPRDIYWYSSKYFYCCSGV